MITLDAKTDYSFMRGFGSPAQWLDRAIELEAPVFGVADYCSTWGHVAFRDAFAKSSVKLLYGVQLPTVLLLEKDPRHALVTLIAKSDQGLKALYETVTTAHKQTYYRPRVTWKQVRELHGLCEVIVTDASISDLTAIRTVEGAYISARPRQDAMLHFVRDSGLPVVATTGPTYPSIRERQGFELVQAISDNHRIGEVAAGTRHWLRRDEYEAQMRAIGMEYSPAWKDRMLSIAYDCNATLAPATPIQLAGNLEQLAREGARARGIPLSDDDVYGQRLARELAVIREKNFESYFLFVYDLVQWSKARMLVGPGRGSAGGSLLCYLLGITAVDPIRHGTLFERFIDITRPDWPDIDIDFPDTRRDLVFDYLKDTYGERRVARLGTISEFGGKSALNDTAKATGVELSVAREIGKCCDVPQGMNVDLEWVFNACDERLIDGNPSLRLAASIEGHPRHHGVHAAGVVVNNAETTNWGAVDKNGTLCMDMKAAENIGMIKMDALGLRTLSVIQDCCDQIGMDPTTLYDLDLKDPKVFETIFGGDRVTGVFQFEGHAVRQLMKQVPVDHFDDLCALTSLARPGPLMGGAAGEWCVRRRGEDDWQYFHPLLEKHTKNTFGTIVYQEQAMSIVRDLGMFTEPEVNGFRRAVGKKDPAKLATYRNKFVFECTIRFGASTTAEDQANELWDKMCEFGSYAFNYSHAVAYSMISYASAYLKCYHPLEFALAQLRCSDDEDRTKQLLREITEEGHAFTPFDPHRSDKTWAVIDGRLFGGFDSVKGVGHKTAALFLAKRNADPEGWLDKLTQSQRDRLLKPFNTPWHTLSYFGQQYAALYADPINYQRAWNLNRGIRGSVTKIKDIPPVKGNYAFLGRITKKVVRDLNDAAGLAKRNGKAETKNTTFINVYVEDDTDEVGMTINRWKAPNYQWLVDQNLEGRDFFIRGDIINEGDGRRWLFVETILEMKE